MRTVAVVLTTSALALAPAGASPAGPSEPGVNLESELRLGGVPYRFKLGVDRQKGITVRGEVDADGKQYRLRLDLDADVRDPEPAPRATPERI
jgi:hypothetical protein